MTKPSLQACPCGGKQFALCCGPYLANTAVAPSAAALMRARYSATVLRDEAFLKASWYRSTRPATRIVDPSNGVKWIGLEVLGQQEQGDNATVEFIARYKIDGRALRLHEASRFVREEGHWFYLDGRFPEASVNSVNAVKSKKGQR